MFIKVGEDFYVATKTPSFPHLNNQHHITALTYDLLSVSHLLLTSFSVDRSRYLLKMCTSFYKFQMMMGMKLSSLKEYPKDGGKMKFILTIMYFKNSVFNVIEVSFTKVVTVCCRQQLH